MASVTGSVGRLVSRDSLLLWKRLQNLDSKGVSFTLIISVVWAWVLFLWRQLLGQAVSSDRGVRGGSGQAIGSDVREDKPKMESVQQKGGGEIRSSPGNETETEQVVHPKSEQGVGSEVDEPIMCQLRQRKEESTPMTLSSKIRELEQDPFRGFHEYRDF